MARTRSKASLTHEISGASQDRFVELYDFAPTGYVTLDTKSVVRECNLSAAAMIGRSKTAMVGVTLTELIHPDDRADAIALLRRCRTERDKVATEFRLATAAGSRHVQVLCRSRAVKGAATEFFITMVDVTERRQMELERIQMALERAALAGRLLSAQEDERRTIARNLHDDVGPQATALRLTVEHLLANTKDEEMRTRLAQVRQSLAELDTSLHRVSVGLRPAALDLGIVPAVRQLLDDWSATSGVGVTLRADDLPELWLSPEVETHTFRILQEALTNVVKHAGASTVTVVLEKNDAGASLVIEDDGRGFDVKAVRGVNHGLGLIGMRERVQLVGGRLDISAASSHGTVVSVIVPRKLPPPGA
jgi:PAS domain S-box-containing protein